ncbi:unnamed protein product [Paramecium sonneborni]|uniref:Uncharacterized protein n=1 Tax=Paramecium sonneborni TaxID=65129 RepID=A0A8S1R9A9_9CILI|nr:unnamed protein product [Paramecium sonneborni]
MHKIQLLQYPFNKLLVQLEKLQILKMMLAKQTANKLQLILYQKIKPITKEEDQLQNIKASISQGEQNIRRNKKIIKVSVLSIVTNMQKIKLIHQQS